MKKHRKIPAKKTPLGNIGKTSLKEVNDSIINSFENLDLSLTSTLPLEHDPSPTRGQAVNRRGVNWVVSGRSVSQPTSASVFPSPGRQDGTEWQQKKVMTCYLYDFFAISYAIARKNSIMQRCVLGGFFQFPQICMEKPSCHSSKSKFRAKCWLLGSSSGGLGPKKKVPPGPAGPGCFGETFPFCFRNPWCF